MLTQLSFCLLAFGGAQCTCVPVISQHLYQHPPTPHTGDFGAIKSHLTLPKLLLTIKTCLAARTKFAFFIFDLACNKIFIIITAFFKYLNNKQCPFIQLQSVKTCAKSCRLSRQLKYSCRPLHRRHVPSYL